MPGKNKNLVGTWNVNKTISFHNNDDSITVLCNQCPEVVFTGDETGAEHMPGKHVSVFNWQLDSVFLTITRNDEHDDSDVFIPSGIYNLQNSANKMMLTDTVKDIKYILSR